MLGTDGKADGVLEDAGFRELLRRHFRMRGVIGVDHQALDVRHVGQKGEDLQSVDEGIGLFLAAFDIEGKDRSASAWEVFLVKVMLGMARERRVAYALHLGMGRQVFHHLLCILRMPVQAQGQCLQALQEDPGIEGRDGRPCIP